jgi:hypothetical protein
MQIAITPDGKTAYDPRTGAARLDANARVTATTVQFLIGGELVKTHPRRDWGKQTGYWSRSPAVMVRPTFRTGEPVVGNSPPAFLVRRRHRGFLPDLREVVLMVPSVRNRECQDRASSRRCGVCSPMMSRVRARNSRRGRRGNPGERFCTIATILLAGQIKCGTPIRSPGLVSGIGVRKGGSAVP